MKPSLKVIGTCLVHGCRHLQHARGMCNAHYLKAYFARQPKDRYEKGRSKGHLRRNVIARDVQEIVQLTRNQSEKVVTTIFQVMTDALLKGESVSIEGFGTFHVHNRNKYVYGYNCYFVPDEDLLHMITDEYKGQ